MKNIVIETKKLCKTYKIADNVIEALKDVNIKIYEGDFAAIVGKSGSGKSTLMHLIGLLDTPTSGEILVSGQNTSKLKDSSVAKVRNKEIGFVFQSFNLLNRTSSLDNVMLPLKYSKVPQSEWKNKALDMLKIVGLLDRVNNKSNELSGGQKQRVAIARALVNDPAIILADEPTGNLDSKTGTEIFNLFKDLNKKGKTIVIVTHDHDLAHKTNKVFEISDGQLVSDKDTYKSK